MEGLARRPSTTADLVHKIYRYRLKYKGSYNAKEYKVNSDRYKQVIKKKNNYRIN